MIIVGDIGNTETKICLVNSKNIIIKRVTLLTKKISHSLLNKSLFGLGLKDKSISKCLFCSVVPKSFNEIKNFFNKTYKIKCHELKKLKLNKLLKIKVNYKQIGSDRLANAIGIINNKDNFIILDFGTATTFDVLIKNIYQGGIIEHTYIKDQNMSSCLKAKRIVERSVNPENIRMACGKVAAILEEDMGRIRLIKIVKDKNGTWCVGTRGLGGYLLLTGVKVAIAISFVCLFSQFLKG